MTSQTQEEITQLRAEVERLKQRESYLLDQYGLLKSQLIHEAQKENEQLKKQNTELDNANWECEKRVTIYSEMHRKSELKRQELQSLVDDYQTSLERTLQLPALEKIRDRILLQQPPAKRREIKRVLDALIAELALNVTVSP
jgi:hypothetical protein